jgi:hypothetical protein
MIKILSLKEFVFWIHSQTQSELKKEFQKTFHDLLASDAKNVTVEKMLANDAIKFRLIVEYAKFLNKKLDLEMFEGDDAFILGGEKIDNWDCLGFYRIKDLTIFFDLGRNKNQSIGKTIEDIAGKDIELCRKIFSINGYLSQKLLKFK